MFIIFFSGEGTLEMVILIPTPQLHLNLLHLPLSHLFSSLSLLLYHLVSFPRVAAHLLLPQNAARRTCQLSVCNFVGDSVGDCNGVGVGLGDDVVVRARGVISIKKGR